MRTCDHCETGAVKRSGSRFCSHACYAASRRGKRGPGNFAPGDAPTNKAAVGTVRIRTRHGRGGTQRAWVKVAEPNVWRERARVVWEAAHGAVPEGHHIHHRNRDKLDDSLANLECVSAAEHMAEHHSETVTARQTAGTYRNRRRYIAKTCAECGRGFQSCVGKMERDVCRVCRNRAHQRRYKARQRALLAGAKRLA